MKLIAALNSFSACRGQQEHRSHIRILAGGQKVKRVHRAVEQVQQPRRSYSHCPAHLEQTPSWPSVEKESCCYSDSRLDEAHEARAEVKKKLYQAVGVYNGVVIVALMGETNRFV